MCSQTPYGIRRQVVCKLGMVVGMNKQSMINRFFEHGISVYWEQHTQELERPLLERRGFSELRERGTMRVRRHAAAVATAGPERCHEGVKAMDGEALRSHADGLLLLCRGGRPRGRHRIASGAVSRQVFVVTQQGSEGLTPMPFDIIRQDTQQEMGTDTLGLVVVHRSYEDVEALQGPQESFDDGQIFYSRGRCRRLTAAQRAHWAGSRRAQRVPPPVGSTPGGESSAAGHRHGHLAGLAQVRRREHAAHFLATLSLGPRGLGASRHLLGHGRAIVFRGFESRRPFPVAFLGDERIVTRDQALPGPLASRDFGSRWLHDPHQVHGLGSDELPERLEAQRTHPPQPRDCWRELLGGLGEGIRMKLRP